MVDTMIIYKEFKTYREYIEIKNIFRDYVKEFNKNQQLHHSKKREVDITFALAKFGMEEVYFSQNIKYLIYIKLRPKLMIEEGNYNEVLRGYDVPQLYKKFHRLMNIIGIDKISDLQEWKVKRIDYAVDIILPQNDICKYIELFKKGNISENLLKNEETQKYISAPNNLYLMGTCYTVNFYDRYTTVCAKQKNKKKVFSNINDLYGIFRFEVQLTKINITKLKKSGKIKKNTVKEFLNINMCRYFIMKNYETLIGKGHYYAYPDVLSKCKSSTQIDFLRLIHNEGSIYQAKREYLRNAPNKRKAEKKFSEIINKFNSNNINPVTAESGELKNLYNKILYAINGSNKLQIKRRKIKYEE